MSLINGWLEYLDGMAIHYSHSTHPWAGTALSTAQAENVRPSDLAKTVVYSSDAGFGMAVVPADQFVDLAKVARALKLSWISLADNEELLFLFPDCELGAMPPFGRSFHMPVVTDTAVATEFIAFAVGTHKDVVRMRFSDFQRLSNPVIAAISLPSPVMV